MHNAYTSVLEQQTRYTVEDSCDCDTSTALLLSCDDAWNLIGAVNFLAVEIRV